MRTFQPYFHFTDCISDEFGAIRHVVNLETVNPTNAPTTFMR
jgi:hypothetical protein